MAQNGSVVIDVLSRTNGAVISQLSNASQDVTLNQISIIRVHATRDVVARYERVGNDLIIHMQDGRTVRYHSFFDTDGKGHHSELIFDDGEHPVEHAAFIDTGATAGAVPIVPAYETLPDVGALLIDSSNFDPAVLGAVLGVLALGAGIAIAAGGSGGGGGSSSNNGGSDGGGNTGGGNTGGGSTGGNSGGNNGGNNGGTTGGAAPTLTLSTFANDNTLNRVAVASQQTFSGISTNAAAGSTIVLTINGKTFTTTVDGSGRWNVPLPASELQTLADGTYVISVTLTNTSGETVTRSVTVVVDTTPPALTINPVDGDNVIDANGHQQPLILTGTASVSEAGRAVDIVLNGIHYSATVGADGTWSVTIPANIVSALAEGAYTLTASLTDAAGNPTSAPESFIISDSAGILTVNPVSGDGQLNASEAQSALVITGTTANVPAGTEITVTVGSVVYHTTTTTGGGWSLSISPADLQALADGSTTVTVSMVDSQGNTLSQTTGLNVAIHGVPPTLDPVFGGDNTLDASESTTSQTLTGNTGLTGNGQTVTVTVGGQQITGTVAPDGTFTVTVPSSVLGALPQGSNNIVVAVTDPAGNHSSITTPVTVDTVAPTLVINPLAGDGQISLAEAAGALTLTGTASSADSGRTVNITIDGHPFTAIVGADGAWSTSIPAGTLSGLNGDFPISATLTDAAGNTTTSTRPLHVAADSTLQPGITVNAFGGDKVVDGAEVQTAQVLTGSTTLVEAGQIVTVTLNGRIYEATVQASGNWSVIIPAADMVTLTDGTKTINVSVSDKAGNPATGSDTFDVDTSQNGIAIDPVTGDNVINAVETANGIEISGTTLGVAENAIVTVRFGSLFKTATVGANGRWFMLLSTGEIGDIKGANPDLSSISATVEGPGGVILSNSINIGIDNTNPVPTLNTPFGDGLLNSAEAAAGQTLSGTTGKSGDGQTVTVTLGGHTYNATVAADGNWSVQVPVADLQALPQGNVAISVTVTDSAGNTAAISGNATADFTAPLLTVNPVSGDGYINGTEAAAGVAITGTASISEAGRTVTVTLNGETYTGIVQPNGQWSVSVPAAVFSGIADGNYPLQVQLSDAAGNTTTVGSNVQLVADAANGPTITVNTFAGNNVLDGAEQQTAQSLSGSTSQVEAGQTVLILLNGHSYTAVVQPSGNWSISIPAADLATLANGTTPINVSVADKAGNIATGSETLTVNNQLSGLSVNPVAGDNQLNASEAAAGITLSGTSANVPVNSVVTITLNGKTYTATIGTGGAWSTPIPAADLALLSDGNNTVKVSATDAAGNPVSGSSDFGVIIHSLPVATLDTPFGDKQLNASEAAAGQTLTGSTGVSGDAQAVTVTVGGILYTATVDANGNWSAIVPAGDLQAIPQGPAAVQVTVTDAAGNTSNISVPVTIDTVAPVVTINPVAGDGIINAAEAGAVIPVSGTAGAGEAGDIVTLSIAGHTYTGTVVTGGGWTVNIPADALANVANGTYILTVTVTDAAGNAGTTTTPVTVKADPALLPTIEIDLFAGDGTLDGAERTNPQTVSGTTTQVEAGQIVTVSIGSGTYQATVLASGAWSVSVSAIDLQALQNGTATIEVSVADKAGNPASNSEDFTVNSALGGVTINPITGDNKIDATEAGAGFDISGKTANVPEGTPVTVKLGTVTYTTQTNADGNWTINVPSGDVANLADGTSHVIVTTVTTDQGAVTATQDLGIYTTLPQPTLNTPFGDGLLSSTEAATDQILTGKTGLTGDGQTVTVIIDGTPYTGTVATDGSWTVTIPSADLQGLGEGTKTLTVNVTDAAGNTATLPGSVDVDFTPPSLSLDNVATDNVINAAEAGAPITLSGTSDPADAGQTVTLTFNGQTYTAEVQPNGSWSTTIPANTLNGLADGSYPLTAELTDAAGNTTTLPPVNIELATQNVPVPTIETPFGDTFLNQREADTDQTLTGTTGVTGAGQTVVVNIGGGDHSAVVDANGIWTVNLSAADLQAIPEGPQNVVVTATDSAGNAGTVNSAITVDYTLPTLTFNPVATDDIINAAESLQPVVISGSADIPDAGQTVSVVLSFNNVTYTAVVQPDGTWSFTLPSSVVQSLTDTTYTLTATITDAAGNSTTAPHTFSVDANPVDLPTLLITAVSGDDYINAIEKGADIPITGTSTHLENGQIVVVSFNGKAYNAVVDANGNWTATVPLADLGNLSDGPVTVTATATDLAGNPASASHNATVITQPGDLPTLTINAISGDDYINIIEHNQGMTVSGTSAHVPVNGTVTVIITGENYSATYTATVQADGSWSFPMTAAQVQALPAGNNTFTATADDVAQNVAMATHNVAVDTAAPILTVTVDTGGDNIINLAEAALGIPVSGSTDPNLTVTVTLNGKDYTTTADGTGAWSLTIPGGDVQAITTDGSKTIDVRVTDAAGNNVSTFADFTLSTHALPVLTFGVIAGNGILNISEAANGFTLSGTSSGLAPGTTVQVTVPGLADPISGTVNPDGLGWTAIVSPGLLSGLTSGIVQVTVTAEDVAGNPASSSVSLDIELSALPVPTINPPFVDGILNATEAAGNQLITGSTGITGAGQTVLVTVDGTPVLATVGNDGTWTATVPSGVLQGLEDATHTISVTATDSAGNTSAAGTLDFTALTHVLPVAGINQPFGDGILNFDEASNPAGQVITGTTGITSPGQTVTVVINGNAVPVVVDSAAGTWSVSLTSPDLLALQDGSWPVVVTVTDSAGNSSVLPVSVGVQIHNVPAPTINLPFGDGTLNIAESTAVGGQTLTGTTGVTGAGQTVSVAIAGITGSPFTAIVDPATGNWSLNLTPAQLATLGLATATHEITVTATDSAGNHTDATLTFTSYLSAPVPVIDLPFGDGNLNIAEAAAVNVITGNTGITGNNQNVKLTIDVAGTTYTATVDPSTGDWSVSLPAGVLNSLGSGLHDINVTVTDAAGNSTPATQPFNSYLTVPDVTINTPFGDGYLSAAEAATPLTLTGTTGLSGTGQTVVVTLGGIPLPGVTVDADGNWSVPVTAGEIAALPQGAQQISVSVTDGGGNTGSASADVGIAVTQLPSVAVTSFAGAGFDLTYAESQSTQTITGTTVNVQAGQQVTVTVGSISHQATVQGDGSWSVTLTPDELGTLSTGQTIGVAVSDLAGNPATATSLPVTVNLIPPAFSITLDPVTGDNIINVADGNPADITLSGKTVNVPDGTLVTVTVGGNPHTTTVNADVWTLPVPASEFVNGTTTTVTASTLIPVTNVTQGVLVDTTAPTLTISAFTGDDILNNTESKSAQLISGTADTSEVGRVVTVTLNGKTYSGTVQTGGTWSVSVPAADLQALPQGTGATNVISATLTDAAGNVGTAVPHTVNVDTSAPLLALNAVAGNNVINLAESLLNVLVGGTSSGADGQTVNVTLGGASIGTALIQPGGAWSLNLTPEQLILLNDGTLTLAATVTDAAGNTTSVSTGLDIFFNKLLDLNVASGLGLTDGFLNLAESQVAQTLSGTVIGAGVGSVISTVIDGTPLSAIVGANGLWSLTIPAAVLGALTDGAQVINLTLTDAAGNTKVEALNLDVLKTLPVLGDLTPIFGGNGLLNAAESLLAQTIGGAATAVDGTLVTVTLGGKTYNTTVTAGTWNIQIQPGDLGALLDGTLNLGITLTDPAGNTSSTPIPVGIAIHNLPQVVLNTVFGDGVLNIADLLVNQTISGTVSNVAAGTAIAVQVGTQTINGVVDATGHFLVTVPPSVLGLLSGTTAAVSVTVADAAGNVGSAAANAVLDLVRPVINLTSVLGDGLLNAADALTTQVIGGTVSGVASGTQVQVTLGGKTFLGATNGTGAFSITLQPGDLKALGDGTFPVVVSVTDNGGNTSTSSSTLTSIINAVPKIVLDPVFGADGILNAAEALLTQTISGTVTNGHVGETVNINVGGGLINLTATVGSDGKFSASLTPLQLAGLLDGNLTLVTTVTDEVGNTASNTVGLNVGIHNLPSIVLNPVFGDGVLNVVDLLTGQTISGIATNVAQGTQVQISLNGKNYLANVGAGGVFSVTVPVTDLGAILNGSQSVVASLVDGSGNPASVTNLLNVVSQSLPTITLNPLFGDGLLNAADALLTQTISGTTTNAQGSTVTLNVGGNTLTALVKADGTFSVAIPQLTLSSLLDGALNVGASVTNAAGHAVSGSATATVGIHTLPTLSLGSLFGGDGYLNAAEAGASTNITGTSNLLNGTVSVTIGGVTHTGTITNGAWSVPFTSAELKGLADGSTQVSVSVADLVGNTAIISNPLNVLTHALPLVALNPLLGLTLGVVGGILGGQGLTLSGTSRNIAQGGLVSVTLLGNTLAGTVQADGSWTVKLSSALLSSYGLVGLLNALLGAVVELKAVDAAGNGFDAHVGLTVGSTLPAETSSLAVQSLAVDDTHTLAAVHTTDTSSATSDTSATHATSTLTDPLVTADNSSSTTTTPDTTTADTIAHADTAFSIGGMTIDLTAIDGVALGGAGNDTISVHTLDFSQIDGGTGVDTLLLAGTHQHLDLTLLGLKVEHIDIFDLGNSGTNSISLNLHEALNVKDNPSDEVIIRGVEGSLVNLQMGTDGAWNETGQRTVDGLTFDVYHNASLDTSNTLGDVLVQHGLHVQQS
ncbi:Ig-like domain-containing protein [Rahnella aquatilis]|nr:Ig-like domain-containing protein [Rahnella aquatilis]